MVLRKLWILVLTFALVFLVASCSVAGNNNIANTNSTPATFRYMSVSCADMWCKTYKLGVVLTPTGFAQADKLYTVDLYERGNFRASTTLSWSQLELNVQTDKVAEFPVSNAEGQAYFGHDMSNIFSVKVH